MSDEIEILKLKLKIVQLELEIEKMKKGTQYIPYIGTGDQTQKSPYYGKLVITC